ncbi:MAG: peptidase M19 [Dehalococcoidia bacterium]|nr:peptidase M19 [Dehalococcoidia bacterium]
MKSVLVSCAALLLLTVIAWVATDLAAAAVEASKNPVGRTTPYEATLLGADLHRRLIIADLHADSLLWNRDLNQRGSRGQVDVPRLLEGNVTLQVFSVVTKAPGNLDLEENDESSDVLWQLVMGQKWPPSTWNSALERALHQARKLKATAQRSDGRLALVQSRRDLDELFERRRLGSVVGAVLALEGMHALEGRLENIDRLFDAGFRMMAPAHFFDTFIGGSAHGVRKHGLTELGRTAIQRMEEKGITLDLAHISPAAFDDAITVATRPVVVSHKGVKGTCDNNKFNLSDAQLTKVARNGGVVGIGYWPRAVCGGDVSAIVRAIDHAVSVAGIDHVGLGSDFDGSVSTPFDAAGLVELTDALLAAGFSEEQLRKVMGKNVLRVLRGNLQR